MYTLPSEMRNQSRASSRSLGKDSETPVSTTKVGHLSGVELSCAREAGKKQSSACFPRPGPEVKVVVRGHTEDSKGRPME